MKVRRRISCASGWPARPSSATASGGQSGPARSAPRDPWKRAGVIPWICAAAVGSTACAPEAAPVVAERSAATSAPAGAAGRAGGRITLITGDRVTLDATPDAPSVQVEPAPGRGQIGFVTVRHGDDVLVIPHDVAPLIAAGRVDRALFDVTRLIADGYGDGERDDLPLIVTGAPAGLARSAAPAGGLTVDRVIPSLGVTAVRQRKSSPGAALAMVQSPAGARAQAAAPVKLWLDRRRRPVLDRSVPQIGGPAARARGATGEGVVVAVLDSGIDASHPDLAGKVIAAEAFIDDGLGTSDVSGHATHVASIIAGSGAASGGLYRGVAPDARLLSGRVCSRDSGFTFCTDSAILAAMAWAVVDRHAPIVNLSLGGTDEPGLDPLEEAVNQLSAQYGTLFVVAAGNDGRFGDQTIESPGSAEAALTVGAVDRDDQLAVFSSRGPNLDGRAIKPDVTAPGVGIVAARATTVPPIGDPVGAAYQALSGTSMATPHVAGAAALVLQQHPGWTGAELKAALIGAASANPVLGVFAQGAGRIDVDRATRQAVIAGPVSLSLGTARWPHTDDPVLARSVRYRNDGAAPVTLTLTASLAPSGGGAAPAGMIRVDPAALVVPAGGTADATVTVDTNGDAPDSDYGGAVIASDGELRVVTPVAIAREVESYDLTLRAADRAGDPVATFVVGAPRRRGASLQFFDVDGETTHRVLRDEYGLYAFPGNAVMLAAPRVVLDHDLTLDFDARLAELVQVGLDGVPLETWSASVATWDPANRLILGTSASTISSKIFGDGTEQQLYTGQVGGDVPAEFRSMVLVSAVPAGSPIGTIFDRPAIADPYAFGHVERGRMVTGWGATLSSRQLTTVDASHVGARHSRFRRHLWLVMDDAPEVGGVVQSDFFDYPAIGHRTEHLFGPGLRWGTQISQDENFPDVPPEFGRFNLGEWLAVPRYQAGHHYVERWHHAPFGPSLGESFFGPPAARTGDQLKIAPSMFSDRNLPARTNWAASISRRMTLFRNGEVFFDDPNEFRDWFPAVAVPPEPAIYRFEQEEVRGPWAGAIMFELSTRVSAAWTFPSQHVVGSAPAILPLPTVRFVPELDDDDRAPSRVMLLPVVIERPPGAASPRIARITVEISFDDGATWSRVPGLAADNRWLGLVVHPASAAFASLRGTVEDVDGRRNEVTIIRAYRVTAP